MTQGVDVEKSLSTSLSASLLRVRLMVLRVGFRFRLTLARVRTPAPSRLLLTLLAGWGVHAHALPTGGQVAAGNVTINAPSNGQMNIVQTTNKGVIDWQAFNVGTGEKVNFLQPGASSSTLNRVVGSDPSAIYGQIDATGQVFLINQNGVLFAPGSQVNASGLVASTLQLSDSDYLAGRYSFNGTGGSVDNQGSIRAGFAVLAGAQVSNTGSIVANGGTVALAAGGRVTMNLTGSDVVSVSVDAPTVAALARAGGIIQADGGQVLVSAKAAGALLDTVVNVDGLVQARSIGTRNGVIVIDGGPAGVVDVTGALDASGRGAGQTGGTAKVLGQYVGLFDNARVDVGGDAGGGTVRVGGDWHGTGPDADASRVFVAGNATIDASAVSRGNGGDVVLWSNDETQFFGTINARAGSTGGAGGQVETSSHDILQSFGNVDASSPRGQGGNWLLDPNNIEIVSGNADTNINPGGTGHNLSFVSSDDTAKLSVGTLQGALSKGNTVTVRTASNGANSEGGTISVDAPVTTSLNAGESATLNLNAQKDIVFGAAGSITAGTGASLNVNLNAGTSSNGTGTPGTNLSVITMDPASSIDTGGGSLTATSKGIVTFGNVKVGGDLTVKSTGGNVIQVSGTGLDVTGAVSVDATNGAAAGDILLGQAGNSIDSFAAKGRTVQVTTGTALSLGAVTGASLYATAGGPITQASSTGLTVSGIASFTTATDDITIANATNGLTNFAASTTGNVSVVNNGALTLGAVSGGTFSADTSAANGNISQTSGALAVTGAASLKAGTGNITLTRSGNSVASLGASGGAVSYTSAGSVTLDNVAASSLTIASSAGNGAVTQGAGKTLVVNGATAVNAGSADITLANAGDDFGSFGATTTGAVTVKDTNAIGLDGINASTLTINAGGAVTQSSGVIAVNGTSSVTTSAGVINLGAANTFGGGVAAVAPGAVTLRSSGALLLDHVAGQSLTATSNGAITQNAGDTVNIVTVAAFNAGAGDVTIGNAGNTIGTFAATTTGHASVTEGGGIQLGNISAGQLSVDTSGSGGVVIQAAGTTVHTTAGTNITSGAGNITLDQANTIDSFAATTTGTVAVTNSQALALGNISAGTLAVTTSNDNVTQAGGGTLAVTGAVSVNAGTGAVTLNHANSAASFGATGGAVSYTGAGNVVLDNVTATSLAVDSSAANGTVTQSGGKTLHVNGATAVNAGSGDITLANAGDNFGSFGATTTGAVTVRDSGTLGLDGITASTLTVNAGGAITQTSGVVDVTGATAVTTTTGDITMGAANTFAGGVAATAPGNVSLRSAGALVLGHVSGATLTATAAGPITQSDTLNITGAAAFNAGTGDVTIANAGNTLGSFGATTSGHASVSENGALALGNVNVGQLTVDTSAANGAVTQAAGTTLRVTGDTAVTSGSGAITLTKNNALDTFQASSGGAVAVTGTGALVLENISANTLTVNASGTGASVAQAAATALTVANGTTVNAGTNTVSLANANSYGHLAVTGGAVTVGASGNLTLDNVNATTLAVDTSAVNGAVAQTASTSIKTTGAATFATGTGNVALTQSGNSIAVLNATTSGSVSVANAGAIALGNIGTATLAVDTHAGNGAVSQVGGSALNITGAASINAGTGAITLDQTVNAGSLVLSGGAVALTNATGLTLGNVTASSLALDTHAGNGAIAQNGGATLTVSGATTVNAGTGNVTLDQANQLGSFGATSAGAVVVNDTGSLALNGVQAGALTATAGGALTQAAGTAVVTTGAATLDAGAASDITLANAGNHFGGGVSATGRSISLRDSGNLVVNAVHPDAAAGSLSLVAGGSLNIAPGDINTGSGDLTLSAGASIATGGNLSGHNVTLNGAGVTIGNDVNASGTLAITSTGGIAQTAASVINAQGAATFTANGGDIVLGTAANTFAGGVTASGGNVTIAANGLSATVTGTHDVSLDAGSGVLTAVDVSSGGNTSLAGGQVTIESVASTGNLAATTVNNGLIIESGTSGALSVGGTTTLNAGTGTISLARAGNALTGAVTATGGNVQVDDAQALTAHVDSHGNANLASSAALAVDGTTTGTLDLAGTNVAFGPGGLATQAGQLVVDARGPVTQAGTLAVAGTSSITSTGDVSLGNAGNSFGDLVTLAVSGNATLGGASPLALKGATTGALQASGDGVTFGATHVGGTLGVTSTGAVGQTGALQVTGPTTIAAGSNAVTLANAGNSFGAAVTVGGGAVDIEQAAALTAHLNGVGSAIVKSGAGVSVDGTSTGNVSAAGSAVVLGATHVGGDLSATAGNGTVSQTGDVGVGGNATLSAGTHDVTLTRGGNTFGGAVTATGANVALVAAGDLATAVTASADATLAAGGALTVTGSSGGAMALTGSSVNFGAAGTQAGAGLDVKTTGAPKAVALGAGSVPLAAGAGGIGQTGAVAVSGATKLDAGNGDIVLTNAANAFGGPVTATGHVVDVTNNGSMNVTVTASGDSALTAIGGNLVATGSFGGGLSASGGSVSLVQGTATSPLVLGGALGATATGGDVDLGFVQARGVTIDAAGNVVLNGTLGSSGPVKITGASVFGANSQGALDVAAGQAIDITATSGDIGRVATSAPGVPDPVRILKLLNQTGQGGALVTLQFQPGHTAWFRVLSKAQFQGLNIIENSNLNNATFGCDALSCFNVLGQTTSLADSVISNILSAASQDARDAAFGTENLDVAIRKGYVTTIGRVPPGIDAIEGDLGSSPCDTQVTSGTSIGAEGGCSVGANKPKAK
jgi:filamentous hemagglutinin family protein